MLTMTSCFFQEPFKTQRSYDDDETIANKIFDEVIASIKNRDENALKKLFSKNAQNQATDFEKNISKLFDFIPGKVESYDDWGARYVEESSGGWKSIESTYDVKTSKEKYRFAIKTVENDAGNADNIGMKSLYIIKMEDDPYKEYAYWGDGKWTIGINFNKQNPKMD